MFVLGSVGTLALVVSMVRSMLITRNSNTLITRVVGAFVRVVARLPLRMLRSFEARDRWLSGAAPSALLLQLTVYAILFILTLGLAVWGCTDLDGWNALYQSGSTFTTLGIVVPMNGVAAVVAFIAAFLGLVVVAVFIGYLLALYGMYASRESVMARLSTYAGEPAWGPEFLARAAVIGRPVAEAPNVGVVTDWVSELRLTQDMNPVLADFRSTSSRRHWIITLLAAMDAVALRLALELATDVPADLQFLTQGVTTLASFDRRPRATWSVEAHMLAVLRGTLTEPSPYALSDADWSAGWTEMHHAGITSNLSEAQVRERFQQLRALYVDSALTLADRHYAVRAPWSGERTPETPVITPMRAGDRGR